MIFSIILIEIAKVTTVHERLPQ